MLVSAELEKIRQVLMEACLALDSQAACLAGSLGISDFLLCLRIKYFQGFEAFNQRKIAPIAWVYSRYLFSGVFSAHSRLHPEMPNSPIACNMKLTGWLQSEVTS